MQSAIRSIPTLLISKWRTWWELSSSTPKISKPQQSVVGPPFAHFSSADNGGVASPGTNTEQDVIGWHPKPLPIKNFSSSRRTSSPTPAENENAPFEADDRLIELQALIRGGQARKPSSAVPQSIDETEGGALRTPNGADFEEEMQLTRIKDDIFEKSKSNEDLGRKLRTLTSN
ncbi:hypothetical protein JCM33374_g6473 [Metschnikowia sp. JCM 33374]|nr:hypothetical protein JCM33374_g6473 [Metschnikowia sp. JCM 33374]